VRGITPTHALGIVSPKIKEIEMRFIKMMASTFFACAGVAVGGYMAGNTATEIIVKCFFLSIGMFYMYFLCTKGILKPKGD